MSPKETAEIEKKSVTKKSASLKKEVTRKSAVKKSTAKKAVQADSDESKAASAAKKAPAKKASPKKTVKKPAAAESVEPKEVIVMDEKGAALASRVELARKSAAENNAQRNLSARSKADGAKAAKGYKKPARKKVKKNAAGQTKAQQDAALKELAQEAQAGAKIYAGIQEVKGMDYAEVVEAAKTNAALLARAVLTSKAFGSQAQRNLSARSAAALKAFTQEQSHQSEAAEAAAIDQLQAEGEKGAAIFNAIAEMDEKPCGCKCGKKADPAMASRQELAAKSARENNAQKNLSARSAAAAAEAVKNFKKPVRPAKKAAPKSDPQKIVDDIIAEAKEGARIYRLIPEVPGTPYEEVVKEVERKAAMESRKKLAERTRTVLADRSAQKKAEEIQNFYSSLDDQTLLEMAQAVGLDMDYDTLKKELELSPDIDEQTQKYLKEAAASGKKYSFEQDGFDESVIPFLTAKIGATLPHKAADNVSFAKKINQDIDRMLINDSANDTAVYNDLFDDVKRVLMFAQHNGLYTLEEVEKAIPADLGRLADRFMTVAYTILPGWQYNDVKYYEGFLYALMAQFDDLAPEQNRALMDIADLYIKHGDYQKGNDGYGYVLRENQLKDQIYYRFAKVYEPFDLQRAKGIASEALRIVDGRYTYYPQILEILQK